MVQIPQPRTTHVFDKVLEYQEFLDQIPGVVVQSVVAMRSLMPHHPRFATGVCAHFLTHHELALISASNEQGVFYTEAHLANQCRGAFILTKRKKSFPVFLASGKKVSEDQFELHPKGRMTTQDSGTPSLFLEEILAATLPDPENVEDSEDSPFKDGSFFIVVERFVLPPNGERIHCYLVWGRLLDRRILQADRIYTLGEGGLPPQAVPISPSPDLPLTSNVSPVLIEEDDDE
ncbi:hypothetical protein BH11ARM2_BH11ARM2_01200 [soil metagenome]